MSERDLWCSVISQAFDDAVLPLRMHTPEKPKRRISKRDRRKPLGKTHDLNQVDREAARGWLLSRSADFMEVCSHAGVEPDAVREKALSLLLIPLKRGRTNNEMQGRR